MINMDVETRVWLQAQKPEAVFHTIHDAAVSELDRLIRESIPLAVNNRTLTRDLWDLRLTLLQTLLPWNTPQLAFKDAVERIASAHELRSLRSGFEAAVSAVLGRKENPKKTIVDELFCENDESIDIWNRPWNQPPSGWPSDIKDFLHNEYGARLKVVAGIREVPDIGSRLVLVSPLQKSFPLANAFKLLRPGRWKCVHILRYGVPIENDSFTRKDVLSKPLFWHGRWEPSDAVIGHPPQTDVQSDDSGPAQTGPHDDPDPWEIFGRTDPGTDDPVTACMVRLSSGFCIAYETDDQVVLFNGEKKSVPVLDLEGGDLIPVCIDDVDHQLLEETATDQLGRHHVAAEEKRLNAWKQVVRTCLNSHGETTLRTEFKRLTGTGWREDAWSGEKPRAPGKKANFSALIHAVKNLGFFRDEENIDQFIVNCWRGAQSLNTAYRLAGRDLASRLEDELEQQLGQRNDWKAGDEVTLDEGGRKYRVYEVVAVHDAGMFGRGQLRRLKKWQG